MKLVDPHVHLRDWKQAGKETLAHGFDVAWRAGISALFEMPNTVPTLTDRTTVLRRIVAADTVRTNGIFHGLYVGLTDDPAQIHEAVRLHGELFPRVVGFKLYAGHSTGRMGVVNTADQRAIWDTLAREGYRGVVAVHAEREDLLCPALWDPARPTGHSETRPQIAEIASVQTQIDLAEAAGFRGTLHFCHVSTRETLDIVHGERDGLPFTVTIAVTPHHALLDLDYVAAVFAREGKSSPEFSVNPPLRDARTRQGLRDSLFAGRFDWIESDHAPHTWPEKKAGASGLPGLMAFRLLVELMRDKRAAQRERTVQSDGEIQNLCGIRVLEVFGIDPTHLRDNPNIDTSWEVVKNDLVSEYPWDPYRAYINS